MAYFDAILPKNTGTEILSMANESANASASDARSARIAELENELAEIRKQRASLDTEADMGKYKFQYDADPTPYMSYQQNLRSAAQTEAIRKATEEATKQSNAQNQWNSLGDKLEVAQWALRSAQNKFVEAERNQNVAGMNEASAEIERYTKSVKSLEAQRDQIRNKFMKDLEIAEVEPNVDMSDYKKRIGKAREEESISREFSRLDNLLNKDRQRNYTKDEIRDVRDDADRSIPALRKIISESSMSDTRKAELDTKLNELDVKANDWRGIGKGKPTRKLTPEEEKANAEKAVFNADGSMKNPAQLAKLGAKTLRAYQQKYGWNLKAGINRADNDGNK